MKLELRKEIKPDISEPNNEIIWYWVIVDGDPCGASKPFRNEKDAEKYYQSLKIFHQKYGTIETKIETIQSEEI